MAATHGVEDNASVCQDYDVGYICTFGLMS